MTPTAKKFSFGALRQQIPLIGLLLLAAVLRLWGLGWGLPSAAHYYSYHPDESVVLEHATSMGFFATRSLPHFYDYPSLQLYLVNFANSLLFLFNRIDIVQKDYLVWYPQWAKMYLTGRVLSAAMGIGTVAAAYGLGARLWSHRTGLWAALILAIIPLHVQHSHWMTVDVPATFWVSLSLYWSARASTEDIRRCRAFLLAGLFAGLAAATKYNMALVILPLFAVAWQQYRQRPTEKTAILKEISVGILAFVAAFLVTCPGAILEHSLFVQGIQFEAIHVGNSNDSTFKDTGNGFLYVTFRNLDAGMGLPLLLLSLVSVGYAISRRQKGDGILAALALPYYILIGLAAVRYARYTIPLLPVLAVWMGRLLADFVSQTQSVLVRRSIAGLATVILLFTLADCVWLVRPMASTDPRDQAEAWLNVHAPSPAPLAFPAMPWFQTAPVSPYFSNPQPGAWRAKMPPETAARVIYSGTNWDLNTLQATQPAAVIVSEYDYDDPLRLHGPAARAYLDYLGQAYLPPVIFQDPPAPWTLYKTIQGMPTQDLPHDMLYTNPTILVFQRK